jgi:hypothetical protein
VLEHIDARNSHATFDVPGTGNVMMAAGLRATAKAVEHPPEPKIGAPVLDPTTTGGFGVDLCRSPYIPHIADMIWREFAPRTVSR